MEGGRVFVDPVNIKDWKYKPGMMAGGAALDLCKSGVPLDAETFKSVVHDGALMARGMGSFGQLTDAELEGLRHYIRQRARETAPKGK